MMKSQTKLVVAIAAVSILAVMVLRAQDKTITVEGYVLDSACAFTKNLDKPISRDCAVKCAKAGSQLVILGDDGNIYWPIAGSTPASGQNARLMEFAGGRVTTQGKLYDRGGSHAIVIEQIAAAPARK